MMTRQTFARLGRIAGYGIVIAACVFVGSRIVDSGIAAAISEHGGVLFATVAIGGLLYAMAGLLLASAWVRLLRWCGGSPTPMRSGIAIFARTQIAKYLPGNVFHLVGRHLSGRALGLSHASLVCAAWFEAVTLIAAAAVITSIGALIWGTFGAASASSAIAVTALAIAAPFGMAVLLPSVARLTRQALPAMKPTALLAGIAIPYIHYLLFFGAAGAILWLQGAGLGGTAPDILPAIIALGAGAWIVGFLAPGAAAGIGVREAALIAGLSDGLGIADAALIALAFRAATLIGDALLFLAGLALSSGVALVDRQSLSEIADTRR